MQDPSEYTGSFDPVVGETGKIAPLPNADQATEPRVQQPAEVPRRLRAHRFRKQITRWRMAGAYAWAAVMVLGALVGLLFFARPVSSAVEMRNLTAFPEFTIESFLDGSYFTDVSLWYADTYPLREPMVAADHAVDSLFGVTVNGGLVGGNVRADEIPTSDAPASSDSSDGDDGDESEGGGMSDSEASVTAEASSSASSASAEPVESPDERIVAEDIQANIMDGIYVKDGAGYSVYYYDQEAADTYIAAMNKAAERLDGVAAVYSIMSPANSIMLDEEEEKVLGGSDQRETLAYLSSRFDSRVKSIDIIDDLAAHRDEYLYFYTDHHWTQKGAYYAYLAFCKAKGIKPVTLEQRTFKDLGEFRGTYYDTVASMGDARPDTVEAYLPNGTNELTYDEYGETITAAIVDEGAAEWDPPYKYSAFIQGDQVLETIHNPAITDGSSCLVVKDSYGCAFAPLLVDNYENLYIIDFRYTDENICDFAKANNIQDVIFMTGMKIGLTRTVAETLLAEVS